MGALALATVCDGAGLVRVSVIISNWRLSHHRSLCIATRLFVKEGCEETRSISGEPLSMVSGRIAGFKALICKGIYPLCFQLVLESSWAVVCLGCAMVPNCMATQSSRASPAQHLSYQAVQQRFEHAFLSRSLSGCIVSPAMARSSINQHQVFPAWGFVRNQGPLSRKQTLFDDWDSSVQAWLQNA